MKSKLDLNWNTPKRNNIEYSEDKTKEILSELNARKGQYSFKIKIGYSTNILIIRDRNIEKKYFWSCGRRELIKDNIVFIKESKDIDELKKYAQDFINDNLIV